MKQWKLFLVAIGFLIILISATQPNPLPIMVNGVVLVVAGGILLYKDRK